MGISTFQWAMLALGVLGFAITWTTGVIALTRAVEKISSDASEKVTLAHEQMADAISHLRTDFFAEQKAQDHNFGEVGAAMRQYIANVEKKLHEVEIWGRDNYAVKDDVRDILKDIKDMRADIKSDFRDLNAKIDKQ